MLKYANGKWYAVAIALLSFPLFGNRKIITIKE